MNKQPLFWTITFLIAASAQAQPLHSTEYKPIHSMTYSAGAREKDAQSVAACRSVKGKVHVVNEQLACFHGLITEGTIKPLLPFLTEESEKMADPTKRKTLVINSPGGEITSSLELGRKVYDAKVRLIVDGGCHSSCANYIIPAAFTLVVWDRAFVLMHGSAPRERMKFVSMELSSQNISKSDIIKNSSLFYKALRKYPEFHKKNVVPETAYFGDIGKSEYYLHRYFDVVRNINLFADEKCKPPKGLSLVVGPMYADQLLTTNVAYFWWPENSKELFDVLTDFAKDQSFVLDMDMFPSWISGRGFVQQSTCATKSLVRTYKD